MTHVVHLFHTFVIQDKNFMHEWGHYLILRLRLRVYKGMECNDHKGMEKNEMEKNVFK